MQNAASLQIQENKDNFVINHPVINLLSESVNMVSKEKHPSDLDYFSKSIKYEEYKIKKQN